MPLVRCVECGEWSRLDEFADRPRCPACRAPLALSSEDDDRPRDLKVRKQGSYKPLLFALLGGGLVLLLVCGGLVGFLVYYETRSTFPEQKEDYADARARFQTRLTRRGPAPAEWLPEDPPPEARAIAYTSGGMRFKAWVSAPPPFPGPRKPAVLYLHNGFAFGGEDWEQARPFRDAGFAVMVPVLRAENGQPGAYSMFYDEVEDVLAAAEKLARQPHVDPNRLFVAGHSTGGTLTMLAAMSSKRFRAAASFSGSPDQESWARAQTFPIPIDLNNKREVQMRSPLAFARSFKCPVRIYYGSQEFFFKGPSEETASLARTAGLDVQAVSVPGDHTTSVSPAMRQAIAFFQSK